MSRIAGLVICGGLVIAGAVVHAATTHRWAATKPDPTRAAAAHALVLNLGERTVTEVPSEMPVKERSTCTTRQYSPPAGMPGGVPVVVSVTSGPPGAVSTHTPDVCYPAGGYKAVKAPTKDTVDLPGGGTATVLVAEFEKTTASGQTDRQRVRWAWSADGRWGVPNSPRFAFVRSPELFKLYVVTPLPAGAVDQPDSPAVRAAVSAAFGQYAAALAR